MSAEAYDDDPDPGFFPDEVTVVDGQTKPFIVHDLPSADWALRKIAKARTAYAAAKAYHDAERDRLNDWLDGELTELHRVEEFFGGLLQYWHGQQLDDDPRRKTIHLPAGSLKARKTPDRVEVDDPEAFVCAVGLDSPLVRVRAEPDKTAIKKAITEAGRVVTSDGELVAGVRVIEGEVRFTQDTAELPPQPASTAPIGEPF